MSGLVVGMWCCRRSIRKGSVHNFHQPVSYCGNLRWISTWTTVASVMDWESDARN